MGINTLLGDNPDPTCNFLFIKKEHIHHQKKTHNAYSFEHAMLHERHVFRVGPEQSTVIHHLLQERHEENDNGNPRIEQLGGRDLLDRIT